MSIAHKSRLLAIALVLTPVTVNAQDKFEKIPAPIIYTQDRMRAAPRRYESDYIITVEALWQAYKSCQALEYIEDERLVDDALTRFRRKYESKSWYYGRVIDNIIMPSPTGQLTGDAWRLIGFNGRSGKTYRDEQFRTMCSTVDKRYLPALMHFVRSKGDIEDLHAIFAG